MSKLFRDKDDLIAELRLLVHEDSGRKKRSDRGTQHKYPSTNKKIDKMTIYKRVKARMIVKSQKAIEEGYQPIMPEFDENGFYTLIPESSIVKGGNFKQSIDGRVINHTVRKSVIQKKIDLEKYRFEAWQELALQESTKNDIVTPSPDLNGILLYRYGLNPQKIKEILEKRQITWYNLFQEIYFVEKPEEWTYLQWREHYSRCPNEALDDDLRFNLEFKPGTKEFHPEWEYNVYKKKLLLAKELEEEKERRAKQYISNMKFKGGK